MTVTPQTLTLLFRVLSLAFAVTGLNFLLMPDPTVTFMNGVGAMLGFPEAPLMTHAFWLGLGTSYMAVVTVLAWQIANDPLGRMPMMTTLAVGKAVSSLTCLFFFVAQERYFIYLANFVVDGSLVAIVVGAKLLAEKAARNFTGGTGGAGLEGDLGVSGSDSSSSQGGLSAAEKERLGAVVAGFVPLEGRELRALGNRLEEYFQGQGPRGLSGLRLLIRVLNRSPWLTFSGLRGLTTRPVADRAMVLERMETSRLLPLRLALHSFKLVVMLHHYQEEAAQRAVGMDPDYLRTKLAYAAERRASVEQPTLPKATGNRLVH